MCDAASTPPTPTPADPLRITCPAPTTVQSLNGQPVSVTYPEPIVAGNGPVTAKCSPPATSSFTIGLTPSGAWRPTRERADCASFMVTVVPLPPPPPRISDDVRLFRRQHFRGPRRPEPAEIHSEPTGLVSRRSADAAPARITTQSVSVLDEGVGGETVADARDGCPAC
jgi:hypothetical protein